jgi:hypothetical protein
MRSEHVSTCRCPAAVCCVFCGELALLEYFEKVLISEAEAGSSSPRGPLYTLCYTPGRFAHPLGLKTRSPTMRCWMTADLLCELRLRKSPIVNLVNILFNIAASLYTNKSKTNLALQGVTAPALQLVRRANSCNKEAQNPKGPPQASGAGDPSPDLQS